MTRAANEAQIELWNGSSGDRWTQNQERLDVFLEPLDQAGLSLAAARAGERVVDVGCGCGASSLALAQRVGPTGRVLGVDVSEPMLARARERLAQQSWSSVARADAQSYAIPFEADLIYSRFGVMFFDQPELAFSNLRRALHPSGRLAFVCWRPLEENPWFALPIQAASAHIEIPMPLPHEPGPFSLAKEERIREVLGAAGFKDVAVQAHRESLILSRDGLESAEQFAIQVGPLARFTADLDLTSQQRIGASIRAALEPHATGDVVALPAAVWLVLAR